MSPTKYSILLLYFINHFKKQLKKFKRHGSESGSPPFPYAPFSPIPQTDIAMWQ
jgi:hypothetical protein